jgi:ABC-type arginine/histidine transport system permease subunit
MRLFRGSKALRFCYFFSCYSGFKGFRERFKWQGLKRISGFWEGLREGWFLAVIENELFENLSLRRFKG